MNAKELQRELAKLGASFMTHPGGSGHVTVHGGGKELGPGLVHTIRKQLGLK